MKIIQIAFIILVFLWVLTTNASAQVTSLNQFVNIINPVRISAYTKNPSESLTAQYSEVARRNLAATWLLTYDAIANEGIKSVAKQMNQSQELGIFLEITPLFAKDAGVKYNKTDSWHRANSVFLSGYTQDDRRKLIETAFEKFKGVFGYYPVSVGAWWVDSYSLAYMQKKYHIMANLNCADQFSTDGYQIWGQYFSTPFYPSKLHAGIPAGSLSNKLDVVTMQWASRDPLNGYGRGPASLFSTQDYFTISLTDDYFKKLISFYTKKGNNQFGQITVGLEGDFTPEVYTGIFAKQLDIVLSLKNQGDVNVVNMKDFAGWYKRAFLTVSPAQIFETDDLLGKKIKAVWYQSPALRIHLTYNYETLETKILDLRFYFDNFEEPYYVTPNRDLNLSINIPSIIDSAGNEKEAWVVLKQELEEINTDNNNLFLKYKNGTSIKLSKDGLVVSGGEGRVPVNVTNDPSVKFSKQGSNFLVFPRREWIFPQEGLIFRDLSAEATNFLKQRKIVVVQALMIVSLITSLYFIAKKGSFKIKKLIALGVFIAIISGGAYWYRLNSRNYFVSQAELDALVRLSSMIGGKVVVFDRVCLQCSFHTVNLPAVFANKRSYVNTVSKKEIVYNSSVFTAKTREKARKELAKLNASYIYVVKFEDYEELVPFSPGDLNLEEVYSNANAKIWRIKKV